MKDSETLINAKALISDPQHWTQKANARDSKGHRVSFRDKSAVCLCSLGALLAAIPEGISIDRFHPLIIKLNKLMQKHWPNLSLVTFNDTHTHSEVMELWDWLIAQVKASEENV